MNACRMNSFILASLETLTDGQKDQGFALRCTLGPSHWLQTVLADNLQLGSLKLPGKRASASRRLLPDPSLSVQTLNGAFSSMAICLAFIADRISPDNRAAAFGMLMCSFSVAALIGPSLGGILTPIHSAYVCVGGIAFCTVCVILFIPETLTEAAKEAVRALGPSTSSDVLLQTASICAWSFDGAVIFW